jgi:intraflagellar transport protein 122
MVVQK